MLLFSTNTTITWLAIVGMITFHIFITSTFPLAVPLEWNVFFMFAAAWLFAPSRWCRPRRRDVNSPWSAVDLAAFLTSR